MIKLWTCFLMLVLVCGCKQESKTMASTDFDKSFAAGKAVYNNFCVNCHLDNGKGVLKAFPPLDDSDYLRENQMESIKGIKFGMHKDITVNGIIYKGNMASQGLTNQEVADVMNYINNAWSNAYGSFITAEQVSKIQP